MVLETWREILREEFDLPALIEVLKAIRARTIRVHEVETPSASPFARNLVFAWVAAYMYDQDTPVAERRAAALSLDRGLLRELLGGDELASLLDVEGIAAVEEELAGRAPDRRAVVRARRAPTPPAARDRRPARRDRTGGEGGICAVPARLARDRDAAGRPGAPRGGDCPARRHPALAQGARRADPAGAHPRF